MDEEKTENGGEGTVPAPAPSQPFVHLHLHTDFSLLDGACKIERLMARAGELSMPAVAITDHGNLFGLIEFFRKARRAGIKPLLGCEIYLTPESRLERPERARAKAHHMGLLAKDYRGYQNLTKLVTDAHVKGFYYKPRADLTTLAEYAEGLVGFTGCLQGIVPQALLKEGYEEARRRTGAFVDIFGKDNYVVEIQDHHIEEQRTIIPGLLKLAAEFDLKVVCTNDVHYVERGDAPTHDALLCIQTGSKVADEKRMRYANDNFYLKSYDEMLAIFGERPDALRNTLAVAEMCDVEIPFGENHYPVFTLPETVELGAGRGGKIDQILDDYERLKRDLSGDAEFALPPEQRGAARTNGVFLLQQCIAGLEDRYGVSYDDPAAYEEKPGEEPGLAGTLCQRIDYELGVIAGTGFVDYFLIVADFIGWAREQGIPVGPGRGSGAGCLVAYLLHITDIDPIRFGLLFERFLNPERVSPPDFDIDFCMRRRDEVVDYVREKYGHDSVANIITFGTFGAKLVVRDVARVLDLPYAEADRIAKMVPDDLNITLTKAIEGSAELAEEVEVNPVARDIVEHGKIIEGMVRNTGKHACGVIIGDRPLDEYIPLTVQEGDLTTQFPKEPVEDLGLLKMDFLGLKTLTVIHDAVANVRRTADPGFDVRELELDDAATFELLNSGKTVGVFQLESGGMQNLCRQFKVGSVDEIIALIALYRPGPMDLIPDYIRGKHDPSTVTYPHPLLEEVCEETYGIMVYQEQVMEAAKIVAGYSLGGADILRRAMGKKKKEVMDAEREKFIAGAAATHAIPRGKAEEIFALLEKFAGYGFNKSHSAAYGILSYQTGYLKANYPVQFMAAVLSAELGNSDKVASFIAECGAMGIPVQGPDINRSREGFTPLVGEAAAGDGAGEGGASATGGSILFGLAAIKGVGDAAAQKILEVRDADGPFEDFRDFVSRVDPRSVNKRVMEALIKTGAFDDSGQDRGVLLHNLEALMGEAAALARDREAGQGNFFDLMGGEDGGGDGAAELGSAGTGGGHGASPALQGEPMTMREKLQAEKELLGFYVSGHPMDAFAGLERAINTFRGEEFLKMDNRERFRLCGVVSLVEKKISRRDNRPWCILHLGTREHSYELMVYAEAYARHGEQFEPGACLLLTGTVQKRGDEGPRLAVDSAAPLGPSLPAHLSRVTWVLRPDEAAVNDFLQALRSEIDANAGGTEVQIAFQVDPGGAGDGSNGAGHGRADPGGPALVAETASSLTLRLEPATFKRLREHPAVAGARIPYPELEPAEPPWKRRRNGD